MEVASSTQEVSNHAVSLLASLNLQRDHAQFCDCVIRQRQSPAHLYAAHRCVLAASSPVFASLLSSNSALLELQAPCLSDSVMQLVLNYVYTGTLPSPVGQQQYCSLLTAATYLQMDGLLETLRVRQWTEVDSDDTNAQLHSKNIVSTSSNMDTTEIDTYKGMYVHSLEKQDHQYSTNAENCDKTQIHSTNIDCCIKQVKTDACSSSSINAVDCSGSAPESTVCTSNTFCSPAESVNTCSCIQVNTLMQHDLLHYLPNTTDVQEVLRKSREEEGEQPHSAGSAELMEVQGSRQETLVKSVEERDSPCSLGVTEAQEEAEEKVEGPHTPGTDPPKEELRSREREAKRESSFSRDTCSRTQEEFQDSPLLLLSTSLPPVFQPRHCDRGDGSPSHTSSSSSSSSSSPLSCEAVPVICHSSRVAMLQLAEVQTLPPLCPAPQTPLPAASTSIIKTCSKQPSSSGEGIYSNNSKDNANIEVGVTTKDQCELLTLDYKSSTTGRFGIQNKENDLKDCGLSQMANCTDHLVHNELLQCDDDTKHHSDDETSQSTDYRDFLHNKGYGDYKHNTDSDVQDVSVATAEEHLASGCLNRGLESGRVVTSLSIAGLDTGSEYNQGDQCSRGKEEGEEEEDGYSSWYAAEIDGMDCAFSLHGAERSRTHTESSLHGEESSSSLRTGTDRSDSASYRGHLCYQYLRPDPSDATQAHPYTHSEHKHSHPGHPIHFPSNHPDPCAEGEETGAYSNVNPTASSGAGTQLLLLDISAKPAQLLVSHRARCGESRDGVWSGGDNKGQCNTATFGVDERGIRARTKFGAGGEAENNGKKMAGERGSGTDAKFSSGAETEAGHEVRAGAGEWGRKRASSSEAVAKAEGAGPTTCLPNWVPSHLPDYVQASTASHSPVSKPSTLPVCVPTYTASPIQHPYQCSLCDRSFSQRGSLNRHMRSHLGVRPYPCPRCPMTFSRQYRVTEHMRVHQRCGLGEDLQKPPAPAT